VHRGVAYTGIGGIRGLRKRRELHPCSVLVQIRVGRQGQGPGQGELPASLTASLMGSL
jgi:hypothetical protein